MPAELHPPTPLQIATDHFLQSPAPAALAENVAALHAKIHSSDSTLAALSRIVKRDLGLSLRILRIANSAMFTNGGGRTLLDVHHATAMLGTDALAQLLEGVSKTPYTHPGRELLVLAELTAKLAKTLIARVEPRLGEEAYLTGLVRNLGELLIAVDRPEAYSAVVNRAKGQIACLRIAARAQLGFDFDELTGSLLSAWSFQGAPVLAAQASPEALIAQAGNPEALTALTAHVAQALVNALFRCDGTERDSPLKHLWIVLAPMFRIQESHLQLLSELIWKGTEPLSLALGVTRESLRFREWVSLEPGQSATPKVEMPSDTSVEGILRAALAGAVDRAAWLPFNEATGLVEVNELLGDGWPPDISRRLPEWIQTRKPPYLLAFNQRQDVWIDSNKDTRFQHSLLAVQLKPAAYFLLPVCKGRRVKGCLYFDWTKKREQTPEAALPALVALRDFMAVQLSAM